jgi:hypothetical protein
LPERRTLRVAHRERRLVESRGQVEAADGPLEGGLAGDREDLQRDRLRRQLDALWAEEEAERVAKRIAGDAHRGPDLHGRNRHGPRREPRDEFLEEREADDGAALERVAPADGALRALQVLGPEAREPRRVDPLQTLDVGRGDELDVERHLLPDVDGGLVGCDEELDERLLLSP